MLSTELHIYIKPHAIELWRAELSVASGFKQVLHHEKTVSLQSDLVEAKPSNMQLNALSPQRWQAIVSSLQALLSDKNLPAKKVKVTIANYFVRYVVVPWNSQIFTQAEQAAYLNHCFTIAFGADIKSWNMQQDTPEFGKSKLASAIPSELISALNDVFGQEKMQLLTVQPYLMQVANHASTVLKKQQLLPNFWLVAVEQHRVCVCLIEQGEWLIVRSLVPENDIAAQIETVIQRESLMANLPIAAHPILLDIADEMREVDIENHRIVRLAVNNKSLFRSQTSNQQRHLNLKLKPIMGSIFK